ncbi:MAG: efflux RND transporter periplasmic adaptor subunit [Paludibacter sp.]|nr:efflux RND transporter periplasmic adaptor subunit [Paludibacter sp.]
MKNWNLINKVIIVAVIAAVLVGCNKSKKTTATAASVDSTMVIKVRVATATEQMVEQTASFTTTVLPEAKNSIAPQMPGRIRKIFVEVGNHIVKGQKLVQMDAVQQDVLSTQVENLQATYDRIEQLYNVGGASKQDLDNTRVALDVAKSNLKNTSENTYLLSPLTGVVTARNYDNGDLFNGQVPVLTVMQINPVKLTINISESYLPQIKLGMTVNVTFDVLANEQFTGKIGLIYPTIDPATRTFSTDVTLPNSSGKIHPGMFGRVNVNFGKQKRVLVPDLAVVSQQGSGVKFVYIVDGNKVRYSEVQMGNRVGTQFEILSGIEDGQMVVTAGQSKLKDGAEIDIIK